MRYGAREAVELPNYDYVKAPFVGVVHQSIEIRAFFNATGDACIDILPNDPTNLGARNTPAIHGSA